MNELLVGMGQRIASARKAKRLTQEQLAELSGVSYQTISSAELNKKSLRAENIIKISQQKYFHYSPKTIAILPTYVTFSAYNR